MDVTRNHVDRSRFNGEAVLPFQVRLDDFALAMQDVYDFIYDVNVGLVERGLARLDDMLRPAIMSGLLSDMMTASLSRHSSALTTNCYSNELGTRTATLHRQGIAKLRQNWIYRLSV